MTEDTFHNPITDEQAQRAYALQQARLALSARSMASSGPVGALDLVNVASWIYDGKDPWTKPLWSDDKAGVVKLGWPLDENGELVVPTAQRGGIQYPGTVLCDHGELCGVEHGEASRHRVVRGYDPTHGRIDLDIQQQVEEMKPDSLGQRVAMENNFQTTRDKKDTRLLLQLVKDDIPIGYDHARIAEWDGDTRRKVVAWASAVHLRASGNDVEIPAIPDVLKAKEVFECEPGCVLINHVAGACVTKEIGF